MANIIDINEIKALEKRRSAINKVDLYNAIFVEDGVMVEVDESLIKDWDFTGLNNMDFILMGRYK